MKCKEFEPLIYLYKPGELTDRERNLLDEHLNICADCRKLSEEIHSQSSAISELTAVIDKAGNSSYYKEQIFEKISSFEKGKSKVFSVKTLRNGLYYFSHPIYRYVSAALIAGLVITFLLQNYSAYINISQLEMRFGNPSSFEAAVENKAIVFGMDDFKFLKESSQKKLKTRIQHSEFSWFRGNQFLLISIRKHRFFQDLANHNPGIDPADIIRIYNKSVYFGESKGNQN